jgi:hypothetical protein
VRGRRDVVVWESGEVRCYTAVIPKSIPEAKRALASGSIKPSSSSATDKLHRVGGDGADIVKAHGQSLPKWPS